MHRFFAVGADLPRVYLNEEEYRHMKNAARIRLGEEIALVLEHGQVIGKLAAYEDGAVLVEEAVFEPKAEKAMTVHLIQALPKGDKPEFVVQKATELGVDKITFCHGKNSVALWKKDKVQDKVNRLVRTAREAAKQCGRLDVPEICFFDKLSDALKTGEGLLLIPYENEQNHSIRQEIGGKPAPRAVTFVIGPEGGFDGAEVAAAEAMGYVRVTLGDTILRTETAPLFVLSVLNYEWRLGK